jgi:hypothetical protein
VGEDGVATVHAEAISFPVLVQELVKGLMELVALKGLPGGKAAKVIRKDDFKSGEIYAMILGRQLWMNFVNQLDVNQQELAMMVYDKLVALPPAQFNQAMKTIQAAASGSPQSKSAAQQLMRKMIGELKADLDAQDRDESGFFDKDEEGDEPEPLDMS